VICGEVKGSEDLIVDGRVEGTVILSESRLTIGATANVAADLSAKDVLILGHVQGNVAASGRVELRAGCVVEGDIRALRLAVEDNAIFRGKVDLDTGCGATAGGLRRVSVRRCHLASSVTDSEMFFDPDTDWRRGRRQDSRSGDQRYIRSQTHRLPVTMVVVSAVRKRISDC
jgi:hypothetical protein